MKILMYYALLLCSMVILLSSCSSYKMSTVSSINSIKNDSTGALVFNNDSVTIGYKFSGENNPFTVEVYNKLNEPLYVNWANCALVVKDRAYSFVNDKILIDGESSSVTSQEDDRNFAYSSGTISAIAKTSSKESFLPPKSKTSRIIYAINAVDIVPDKNVKFKKMTLTSVEDYRPVVVKEATFSVDDSPFTFRCYISMYTLSDNRIRAFSHENSFYISKVNWTNTSPKRIIEFENTLSSVIVSSKKTGFGRAVTGAALVGAVGTLVVVDASLNKGKDVEIEK